MIPDRTNQVWRRRRPPMNDDDNVVLVIASPRAVSKFANQEPLHEVKHLDGTPSSEMFYSESYLTDFFMRVS